MFALALALAALAGLSACGHDRQASSPLAPEVSALADGAADTATTNGRDGRGDGDDDDGDGRRSGLPDFDPEDFVRHVDHPYFPLVPGTLYTYRAETEEGTETSEFRVTHDTKRILGITATVVRDKVFVDGELKEDTFDWFAQDEDGNVWYLGEDTKEYENGVVVSTFGSWEAGKNGARAGVIMLAHPRVGDDYPQEIAPGIAEDRARVVALNKTVRVPYGTFRRCIQTKETTPLEPGFREFKYYARGVGLVLEVSGDGERVELTGVTR